MSSKNDHLSCKYIPKDIISFSNRKIIIIGMGSIGRALIPVLLHSFRGLCTQNIIAFSNCIENKTVCDVFSIAFHFVTLTPKNLELVLAPYVLPNDFVLNASIGISSVDLILFCQKYRALYIDTSIEPWEGGYDTTTLTPSERSSAYLRSECLSLKKQFDPTKPPMTAVVVCGANPGMVSWLALQGLLNLRDDILPSYPTPTTQIEWAQLCRALGIKTIHITESDSQLLKLPKKKGEFVNTWCIDGFISENVLQYAEMGWGTHEKYLPDIAEFPQKDVNTIILDRPGSAVLIRSWEPKTGPYLGSLVSHNEVISISQFLSIPSYDPYNTQKFDYSPTVKFVYQPCDAAISSLNDIFGSKTKEFEKRVPAPCEFHSGGIDEIGVLFMGHPKGAYWYGSGLSIDNAKEIAPYNTATSLQVVAGVLAGMVYAIKNPHVGLIESEQIPFREALEIAIPLLEPVSGHYTNWTPIDKADPWQFQDFLFHAL